MPEFNDARRNLGGQPAFGRLLGGRSGQHNVLPVRRKNGVGDDASPSKWRAGRLTVVVVSDAAAGAALGGTDAINWALPSN